MLCFPRWEFLHRGHWVIAASTIPPKEPLAKHHVRWYPSLSCGFQTWCLATICKVKESQCLRYKDCMNLLLGKWTVSQRGRNQYINWESRPRKGGHKGCATSVVFNMVHWYIKPECIYPVTSHPPGNWKNWADILWAGEYIVTHKPGTCLPLPAFSAVWFMHRCVSIPIMYERSRKSDASFCCWFQWDLGSVKSCCRYI